MSLLTSLGRLFRRSTGAPVGFKYLPISVIQAATARKNREQKLADAGTPLANPETGKAPYWQPTQAQLEAAKSGAFSMAAFVAMILNQGQIGSCTANGWDGAYALFANIKMGVFVVLSRLYVYFYERLPYGNTGEDTGAEVSDGSDVLSTRGAPLESDYPYSDDSTTFTQQPPASLDAEAAKHKIVNPMRVRANIDHVKAALKAGKPVVFGFEVYDSFESTSTARTGIVTMPASGEKLLGGHCTYWIGYTDSDGKAHFGSRRNAVMFSIFRALGRVSHSLRLNTGFTAFAVTPPANSLIGVNSWGEGWGNKGMFYMPFPFVSKYCSDFYIFDDVTEVKAAA